MASLATGLLKKMDGLHFNLFFRNYWGTRGKTYRSVVMEPSKSDRKATFLHTFQRGQTTNTKGSTTRVQPQTLCSWRWGEFQFKLVLNFRTSVRIKTENLMRNPLMPKIIRFASGIHWKGNVKRFVPESRKSQADTAVLVIKFAFEIRHLKQRIPGLLGPTCD